MRKMLIVDDNSTLVWALTRYFAYLGFEVSSASDRSTLDLALRDNHIDVAIVDLYMPDLNGLEAIRMIRGVSPRAKLILTSGDLDEDSLSKAKQLGVDHHLAKPFGLRDIDSSVEEALGESLHTSAEADT